MKIDKHNFSIDALHLAKEIANTSVKKQVARHEHLNQALNLIEIPGHVMEFGVYKGSTLQTISKKLSDQICWGFDSFLGLPEPWRIRDGANPKIHRAGKFDMTNQEKPVFRKNVRLVTGWFEESIALWLKNNSGVISFIHIDCDLYSSCLTVLRMLDERIVPGTVIAFDEIYPWHDVSKYDQWPEGEFKALNEWIVKYDRVFQPLLRSRHQQCSIKMIR